MKIAQTLKSGLTIRQDYRECIRFLMFETQFDEWRYATYGGTAFIVSTDDRVYGVTCRHVLKDFNWNQLALTDQKFGKAIAGLKSVRYPSAPTGGAIDSDVLDIVLIEFSDDIGPSFFKGECYIIDPNTFCTSSIGDQLQVNGVLKELSQIGGGHIAPRYAVLDFQDKGPTSSDPTLRLAEAKFDNPEFKTLTGFSGSPVFNITRKRLCGVTVRAGLLETGHATLYYVDFADVQQLIHAVTHNRTEAQYYKQIVCAEKPV